MSVLTWVPSALSGVGTVTVGFVPKSPLTCTTDDESPGPNGALQSAVVEDDTEHPVSAVIMPMSAMSATVLRTGPRFDRDGESPREKRGGWDGSEAWNSLEDALVIARLHRCAQAAGS